MNRYPKTFRTVVGAATMAALSLSAPAAVTAAHAQPAAPAARAQAAAPAAGPTLDEVVAALRAVGTMRANFTQTDRNGQSVSGVVTIKRPGKIRFQYQQGVPLLIVADGRSLTMIDYEVKQVQRWPIRNSPLGALLDPSRDLSRFGTLQPTANPDVASVEVRDRSHPEYGVITLIFVRKASAPGGFELTSWVALDSQNKRTTIRLSGHSYGIPVADSAFNWSDPRIPNRR